MRIRSTLPVAGRCVQGVKKHDVKILYFCCFKIARPSDADHLNVRNIPFLEVVATIFPHRSPKAASAPLSINESITAAMLNGTNAPRATIPFRQ